MILVYVLYLYLAAGFMCAIWLVFIRKSSLNENMPRGVKMIILPGCVILWPVVLFKSRSL
jgi:hypothetical protein